MIIMIITITAAATRAVFDEVVVTGVIVAVIDVEALGIDKDMMVVGVVAVLVVTAEVLGIEGATLARLANCGLRCMLWNITSIPSSCQGSELA